jgi:hypothetical protein
MTHTERWAIVTYVNSLKVAAGVQPQPTQPDTAAAAGATPAPLPAGAAPDTAPGAAPVAAPDTVPASGAANDTVPSQQES